MGDWVHRTTKQHITSVSPSGLPEPPANYISQPDLSAVAGQPVRYWIITGDVITLADAPARVVIDEALEAGRLDGVADELDEVETVLRAFAEVVLDEINILRAEHSLTPRTLAQLKVALRAKL